MNDNIKDKELFLPEHAENEIPMDIVTEDVTDALQDGAEEESLSETGRPETEETTTDEGLRPSAEEGNDLPANIDEAGEDTDISLRSIIGGDILGSKWLKRQFLYIALLGGLSLLYVTNRYSYQHELIEHERLKSRLEDRRKRALVANSELTFFMRNVNIEENLPDTTIAPTVDPFYYINPNEP